MLEVARHRGDRWPGAAARPARSPADRRRGDDRGLRRRRLAGARRSIADVMDWAGDATTASAGTSSSPISSSITSTPTRCAACSPRCARRADALAACEPRRSRFALAASHLIFFLGANAVTRNDGVLSVRAGFVERELGAAWPRATRGVARRRIRRRPLHPLPGRARGGGRAVVTTRFDVAIVGAGPAGASRGDPARARRLVGRADRAAARFRAARSAANASPRATSRCSTRSASAPRSSARAGAELRRVALMRGDETHRRARCRRRRRASLGPRARPRAPRHACSPTPPSGRARRACSPAALQSIAGRAGDFVLTVRSVAGEWRRPIALRRRRSSSPRTARGSRCRRERQRAARHARRRRTCSRSRRTSAALRSPPDLLPVLSFAGGYGGMVVADDGIATLAGCIRDDRAPGAARAAAAACAPATCSRRCCGANAPASPRRSQARRAKARGSRAGRFAPASASARGGDGIFRIGNAAGEAHPIVGEGISMALQSAFVLAALIGPRARRARRRGDRGRGAAPRARRVRGALAAPLRAPPARRRRVRPRRDAARRCAARRLAAGATLAGRPHARRAPERQDALRAGGGAARSATWRHEDAAPRTTEASARGSIASTRCAASPSSGWRRSISASTSTTSASSTRTSTPTRSGRCSAPASSRCSWPASAPARRSPRRSSSRGSASGAAGRRSPAARCSSRSARG